MKNLPDLSELVQPGRVLQLRATPKAARDRIVYEGEQLRVYVTAPPDKGKANAAIIGLLSKAMGIPKSRLHVIRGETARDKQLRID